jgi:hypothetical protein
MSTDGHGYIGSLELPNGRCLNVSLPDKLSKTLIYKPSKRVVVTGRLLPYVRENGLIVRVNGRNIGQGTCGNKYLFVK